MCLLKLLTLMIRSSVFAPSGQSVREQLASKLFSEVLQNYMENKNEGNENKLIFGDFNCAIDKIDRDGGNKARRLYIDVPQLYSVKTHCGKWARKFMEKEEARLLLVHPIRSFIWHNMQNRQGLYGYKNCWHTRINCIMVSFTDHYNSISIERFHSKIKIRKDLWYFNNSFLCKAKKSILVSKNRPDEYFFITHPPA